ncbi:MAG: hypothetical protein ACU0CA_07115 [Paracoccaceae bacterium]
MADDRRWLIWQPREPDWWIATLFMIGATHFALGSVLFLYGFTHEYTLDSVFFIGSLFFTSAAYCQLHQEAATKPTGKFPPKKRPLWRPQSIGHWSALSQFVGTLFFNANTFDAFFDLDWFESELLVWTPNILGSILFQVSGTLAMYNICKRWWCWDFSSPNWWINTINFIGCVAFLISAVLAYVPPLPGAENHAMGATVFTLIGAGCFFIGAYLMWPQLASKKLRSRV